MTDPLLTRSSSPTLGVHGTAKQLAEALAERDRYRNALASIAVGEIPGQYDHDLSAYAHDVLNDGGELQEFPGV